MRDGVSRALPSHALSFSQIEKLDSIAAEAIVLPSLEMNWKRMNLHFF